MFLCFRILDAQDEFEQMRNAELAEVQRLEAESLRKLNEKVFCFNAAFLLIY